MKKLVLLLLALSAVAGYAQTPKFQHVVVVLQENRTPDNLFQGLCTAPYGNSKSCSTTPGSGQYNIQIGNWLDSSSSTGVTQPKAVPLVNTYDLSHTHPSFTLQCHMVNGKCLMDQSWKVACLPAANTICPAKPQYAYVDNSTGRLNPYLNLATTYGFANMMMQTNQGPSFPAHLYMFGGTSAPDASGDAKAIFAAENRANGCTAPAGAKVALITPTTKESTSTFPCFEHQTMGELLNSANKTWKYYTPNSGSLWTAPNAIQHICVPTPTTTTTGKCTGAMWIAHLDLNPKDFLIDIANCQLPNVSWVIPTMANSDHAPTAGGGPSWVGSIVNAIGQSACKNADGSSYWNSTAIIITWDDWGGWYDHVPATILPGIQGDYQYGFRVPLIVVSKFSPHILDNSQHDFGSILRFMEGNFGIPEGALNFSDARAKDDLSVFFQPSPLPAKFSPIRTKLSVRHFITENSTPEDPDD
jgi:phospholipase C